jgi:hypothetical protein
MWCKSQAAEPEWQHNLTFYCIASNNSSCCGPTTYCVMATELHSGGGILNKVRNARVTWQWDVLGCLWWSYSLIYWGQIFACLLSYTWFGMLSRLSVRYHTQVMTRNNDYLFVIIHMLWHVITIICSENKEQTSGNTTLWIGPLLTGTSYLKGR